MHHKCTFIGASNDDFATERFHALIRGVHFLSTQMSSLAQGNTLAELGSFGLPPSGTGTDPDSPGAVVTRIPRLGRFSRAPCGRAGHFVLPCLPAPWKGKKGRWWIRRGMGKEENGSSEGNDS